MFKQSTFVPYINRKPEFKKVFRGKGNNCFKAFGKSSNETFLLVNKHKFDWKESTNLKQKIGEIVYVNVAVLLLS